MLLLYLLLFGAGIVLTTLLARRRSRAMIVAGIGTVLAAFSIISGFSIGIFVAPVAIILLAVSALSLKGRS